MEAVKALGGQDAFELMEKKVPVSLCNRGASPQEVQENKLENILPNLITEMVKKARKEGFDAGQRDIQGIDSV